MVWYEILFESLKLVWINIAEFLPRFILAIIVFIIGWLIAILIYRLVITLFKTIKLDNLLRQTGFTSFVERSGYKFSSGKILGWLVKWFIIIVFLVAALNIMNLNVVNSMLAQVALYIPRVVIAAFILFAGVVLADFVKNLVIASTKTVKLAKSANLLGGLARIAILVFTILIVLDLIGIGATIVNTIFIAFVSMIALAGGLAFGLGGREEASKALAEWRHKIRD